jgi:NAD(P)-dependent dehydrogenase (short-subunit alcohol dehydrogenase family)
VSIVTGAARGIGLATVEVLLREAAIVLGVDRDPSTATGLGDSYVHEIADVTDFPAMDRVVRGAAERFGRIDILVNNAGVHPPKTPIDDVPVEEFEALLAQNLTSMFVTCRAAMPSLRSSQGSIVNVGSMVSLLGQEGAAAYCATKGAISAMSKSLAIDEAAYGVRVNCVCPAAIQTAMSGPPNEQARAVAASFAWLDRRGSAAEVAEVVAFLASERASFITGQDIVISGGADLGYGLKANNYYEAVAAANRR